MENNSTQSMNPDENLKLPTQPPVKKQGGKLLIVIGALILLLVIGGGLYYLVTKNNKSFLQVNSPPAAIKQSILTPSPNESTVQTAPDTDTWETYTNSAWKISFKYPPDWEIATSEDGAGMLVRTSDLKITDYSNVEKGAFLLGPYIPAVLPNSWEKVFDEYTNEKVETINENITIDGQETKVGLLRKTNAIEIIAYYKYPMSFGNLNPSSIQWSFINLITTPSDYEGNKQVFLDILSTFKFID